ncbi:hypothetical protein B5M09_012017, partial [Aphanomyces astaci]
PLAVNEQHMVDILISVFGLSECADTIIGDDMMMLQPPPEVYDLFDNILVLDKAKFNCLGKWTI